MARKSHRTNFRPRLEPVEHRLVPAAWTPIPDGAVVVAPEDGGVPKIHLIDPVTGKEVKQVIGYDGAFRGGIHAELGDVTGDGTDDLVFAPGGGGGPRVTVVDGATGKVIADFLVYDASFRGGIDVAVGDVNNDGFEDILTGAGDGGGPHVKVFDGATVEADGGPDLLYNFFPYDAEFRGGVFVGTGDVNGDDFADIITGTGVGGGSRVVVFDGQTGDRLQSFFAFGASGRTGVRVGAADLDGDGDDEILTGAGPGGAPRVAAFDGRDAHELADFFADDASGRGGVHVGGGDVDGDGVDDLVTQTRHGNRQVVHGFKGNGHALNTASLDVDDNPAG